MCVRVCAWHAQSVCTTGSFPNKNARLLIRINDRFTFAAFILRDDVMLQLLSYSITILPLHTLLNTLTRLTMTPNPNTMPCFGAKNAQSCAFGLLVKITGRVLKSVTSELLWRKSPSITDHRRTFPPSSIVCSPPFLPLPQCSTFTAERRDGASQTAASAAAGGAAARSGGGGDVGGRGGWN